MSDEFTKTVVIRDRSSVAGNTFVNAAQNHQHNQPVPEGNPADSVGQGDYPDFEDTSWLT